MVNPIIFAGIGVGIGIAIFLVLVSMDVNSVQQLQFMQLDYEPINYLDLSWDASFIVCNPTGFPTSFEKIEATIFYRSTELGTWTVFGDTFQPNIAKDVNGRFNINGQNVLQLFLGGIFSIFVGQDVNIDPNDVTINLKVEKKLLGIIPTTTEKIVTQSQTDSSFVSLKDSHRWECGYSPALKQAFTEHGYDTENYNVHTNFNNLIADQVMQKFFERFRP